MKMLMALCVALFFFAACPPIRAQSGGEPESEPEDEIVVVEDEDDSESEDIEIGEVEVEELRPAEGFKDEPGTIQIVGREEIERSGAEDLLDLLRRKVGMNESEIFGGTSIGLLGLPAKFTLVLIDGKRVTGRVFEQIDFNQMPLSAVERIEVIKGPSSTVYGSAAIGGVINVVTRNPIEGISGVTRLKTGSYGLNVEGVGLGWRDGPASLLLDFERFGYDGYNLDKRTIDTDGDAKRHYNAFAKLRYGFSPKSRVDVTAVRYTENRNSIRFAPPDIRREGNTKTRRLLFAADFEWDLRPGETIQLGIHDGSYAHSFTSHFVGFQDTVSTTAFTEDSLDVSLIYRRYSGRHVFTSGAERLSDGIESDRIAAGNANYETNVIFLQDEYKASPKLTLTFGGRIDDNSSYGTHFSPRAGFKYAQSDNLDIRGSIARGFRPPGLRELYFDFNSPFGYRVEGSPDLVPEKSTGYQVSFDWRPAASDQINLILFRNSVSNLIEAVEVTRSPWIFKMTNIEDAQSQGVELGWGRRLSRDWRFSYNFVFVDATDENTGNRLPNSPKLDQRGSINFSRGDWNAEAFVRHTGSRFTDLANAVEAPGFTTMDLHFGYSPGDWDFKLHFLNVLGEVDRRYGPKPGFEWQAEAIWKF